jgi:hypothetical protein
MTDCSIGCGGSEHEMVLASNKEQCIATSEKQGGGNTRYDG